MSANKRLLSSFFGQHFVLCLSYILCAPQGFLNSNGVASTLARFPNPLFQKQVGRGTWLHTIMHLNIEKHIDEMKQNENFNILDVILCLQCVLHRICFHQVHFAEKDKF